MPRRRVLTRPLRRADRSRGAAAVEFALVVVPLFVLLIGIINWGLMLSDRQAVSQAAAEGARAAAVTQGEDSAKIAAAQTAIVQALAGHGVTGCAAGALVPAKGQCSVTIGSCAAPAGAPAGESRSCVEARVVLDYQAMIPGLEIAIPDQLTYTAVAQVG